eukprot:TRINITY_DN8376_c0_g3_i4.p1 TRINITY_DN8376_c0_g3~~TRINITY_DN8376_c0_g3_i4.p1  ORF type:complete len:529 (+),score=49.94 TRINITY_DN8376_c0_g3_i4:101-1687(+)
MAPILSKEPPKTAEGRALQTVRKANLAIDAFVEIVRVSISAGSVVVHGAAEAGSCIGDQFGRIVDTIMVESVKTLESLCLVDILSGGSKGKKKPLFSNLPPYLVMTILGCLYNAFVFGYLPAAGLAWNSEPSMLFHAFFFLAAASFGKACRCEPGSSPMSAEWTTYGSPPPGFSDDEHSPGPRVRWCTKTRAYQPERCYFDKALGHSVLKLDHFCPWLNNTIGYGNYKYFYLFLGYATSACGYLGMSFIELLLHATLSAPSTFCLVTSGALALVLASILVPFFLFHTHLIFRNMTTIEFVHWMRAEGEQGERDRLNASPYDLGVYHNICSALGDNPLTWFLPVGLPAGDGVIFPKSESSDNASNEGDPEAAHPQEGNLASTSSFGESEEITCDNFFVWVDSAEFADDLKVGCEVIHDGIADMLLDAAESMVKMCSGIGTRRMEQRRQIESGRPAGRRLPRRMRTFSDQAEPPSRRATIVPVRFVDDHSPSDADSEGFDDLWSDRWSDWPSRHTYSDSSQSLGDAYFSD